MTSKRNVYIFGTAESMGDASMRALLGGKGANLAEMARLGLPVPPGFTITTEVCNVFLHDGVFPPNLRAEIDEGLAAIGTHIGRKFGDTTSPLLVAVRSGGRSSMPGMMDTVLNLGLNDATCTALANINQNPRFAWDSYRRFIQMFGDVVLGVDHDLFEALLDDYRLANDLPDDTALTADDWQEICTQFKAQIVTTCSTSFPQDPHDQIWAAIEAVFKSWNNTRAQTYRRLHSIPDDWGTAVNIQAMVFGNLGETSATGVAFTRNPSTGVDEVYGEYLLNAQGEDIVAGSRTPHYISRAARIATDDTALSLEEVLPESYIELTRCFDVLETHFGDMQDIEFTIEDDKLWLLQTRRGKRSPQAGLKIVVDLVAEGVIDRSTGLERIDPASLDQFLHPRLDPDAPYDLLTRGLPASPGAASGRAVFTADGAEFLARSEPVILVRMETSPEDIHGMYAASGVLTSRGGMTSHAAVVARGLGRPCVSGASMMRIDTSTNTAKIGDVVLHEDDFITIDGSSGHVMRGEVPMLAPVLSDEFVTIMGWSDNYKSLSIRANAETVSDIETALGFGAEGIGLCRTEHMFFDPDRIRHIRAMILADSDLVRAQALSALEPVQRDDFFAILSVMGDKPTTIRLLDPPLHEFLPHDSADISALAASMDCSSGILADRISQIRETNPMLGHRGCRLAITYPEIYDMQVRALFGAMAKLSGVSPPQVEIMLPLIIDAAEFVLLSTRISTLAEQYHCDHGYRPSYRLGAMIETPRAALVAGEIAKHADFLSFGTNDLTQMTLGISRDDAGIFLSSYIDQNILARDPFTEIDIKGVGTLMRLATQAARAVKADIKIGICGEHGGDSTSIALCQQLGLDYVSCSPFRIPVARLAIAQATIKNISGTV